jgi:hypothetical protein
MPHTTDLSSLPVETALAVAARDMDRGIVAALDCTEITLRDLGATADELSIELEHQRAEMVAWREKSLAELRGWIERDGKSLN